MKVFFRQELNNTTVTSTDIQDVKNVHFQDKLK